MTRLITMCLALSACGSMPPPGPTPVSSTPLAGTWNGVPWRAVSGVASARRAFSDDAGSRWLDVKNGQLTCADFVPAAQIIGIIPWQVGGYDLSFQHNLTFVVDRPDGGLDNLVATQGRVELVDAPGPDAGPAHLRIRAHFDAQNSIEGEVTVTVCD